MPDRREIDQIAEFANSGVRAIPPPMPSPGGRQAGPRIAARDQGQARLKRVPLPQLGQQGQRASTRGSGSFLLMMISAGAAWAFDEPFLFPSLGATVFLMFETPLAEVSSTRNTVIGHYVGAAVAYFWLVVFSLDDQPLSAIVAGFTFERWCVIVALSVVHRPYPATAARGAPARGRDDGDRRPRPARHPAPDADPRDRRPDRRDPGADPEPDLRRARRRSGRARTRLRPSHPQDVSALDRPAGEPAPGRRLRRVPASACRGLPVPDYAPLAQQPPAPAPGLGHRCRSSRGAGRGSARAAGRAAAPAGAAGRQPRQPAPPSGSRSAAGAAAAPSSRSPAAAAARRPAAAARAARRRRPARARHGSRSSRPRRAAAAARRAGRPHRAGRGTQVRPTVQPADATRPAVRSHSPTGRRRRSPAAERPARQQLTRRGSRAT